MPLKRRERIGQISSFAQSQVRPKVGRLLLPYILLNIFLTKKLKRKLSFWWIGAPQEWVTTLGAQRLLKILKMGLG